MARECIFCGSAPCSREHAWPRWILDAYATPPCVLVTRGSSRPYQSDSIEVVLNRVCEACNGGWMSDLESAAKPVVWRMIQGEAVTLSEADQRVVASWGCKTAMVFEHTLPVSPYWRTDEREAFRTSPRCPPGDTTILTAAYTGRSLAAIRGGAGGVGGLSSGKTTAPGTRASICIGQLLLQVASNRYTELTGRACLMWPPPFARKADQIWPVVHASFQWPPAAPMSDAEAQAFMSGWGTDGVA